MFKFKLKNRTLIVSAASLLAVLSISSAVPYLRRPLLDVLRDPLIILRAIGREARGFVFYHRNYVQNERLRNEVDFLKQKVAAGQDVLNENSRLKQLLDLKEEAPFRVVACRVIGRASDSWSSSVIIDKGSRQGLRRGMVVITYRGLVGRIVETGGMTSKVLLLSDPALSVSGIVKRSRQEGLVCGTLGSSLMMKYLPEDSDIQVSDEITTSGLTSIYPKGILIGQVVDVGVEFSGLSRYAVIKPAANLSGLEEVLVIVQ